MNLTRNSLYCVIFTLTMISFTGCGEIFPYLTLQNDTGIRQNSSFEGSVAEKSNADTGTSMADIENKSIKDPDFNRLSTIENINTRDVSVSGLSGEKNMEDYILSNKAPAAVKPAIDTEKTEKLDIELDNEPDASNQELIDTALGYCQASNDFWEQGDLENAMDALDKAYSFTLKVNGENAPELMQQKEDLRFTISKRIIEVYSSRFTVANGSHKAIPLDMNEHVKKALDLFKGSQKQFFLDAYKRSGRYRPSIVRALNDAGLPEELSWLPLIESGYKVRALSSAQALGMWQFIASTGYKFGLKRDTWIDERMDPEKSTVAAIGYLTELHQIFGDWTTALAAYNCGENRVLREIKTQKINYLDNFWDLYKKLPGETAFYVPKFLAVLHIINDPESHGFDLPRVDDEEDYETVTINKQVHLQTLAKSMDMEYVSLAGLNPELRQNLTPKSVYSLKVPIGKGETLLASLEDIPVWKPPVPSYVTHKVRSGETLSVIAGRYKTSIKAIMDMNSLKSQNYLKTGWTLKIPTGKSYTPAASASSAYVSTGQGKLAEYIVKKGDSLWTIANQFNTTVNSIKSLNSLTGNNLQIGQRLRLSSGTAVSKENITTKYQVRKGDSPYLIAKKYRMNLHEFLELNELTPKSTIFPGQTVNVVVN